MPVPSASKQNNMQITPSVSGRSCRYRKAVLCGTQPHTLRPRQSPMHDSHRSSISRRRYRLAQAGTVAGALAVGSLVVDWLVSRFREDFFLFYGVSDSEYRVLQENADSRLPLTVGQLMIATIALVAVIAFITSERRRVAQACTISAACRRRSRHLVVERLSAASLFDQFITRTSSFAGLLLSAWLLQSSLERWLGGFGLGIEYASWRSLLPLASVFGVCVLAGMLVAAVSLVGLRAIHVLEVVLQTIARHSHRITRVLRRPAYAIVDTVRTLRELIGCDILSRPPPLAA